MPLSAALEHSSYLPQSGESKGHTWRTFHSKPLCFGPRVLNTNWGWSFACLCSKVRLGSSISVNAICMHCSLCLENASTESWRHKQGGGSLIDHIWTPCLIKTFYPIIAYRPPVYPNPRVGHCASPVGTSESLPHRMKMLIALSFANVS